jgi:hypothetical protein
VLRFRRQCETQLGDPGAGSYRARVSRSTTSPAAQSPRVQARPQKTFHPRGNQVGVGGRERFVDGHLQHPLAEQPSNPSVYTCALTTAARRCSHEAPA